MPKPKVLVVDGYNVINRLPDLKPAFGRPVGKYAAAAALRVSVWGRLHPETECLIIFDGDREVVSGGGQILAGVRCVFLAPRHGGDEEIIRQIREFRSKKRPVTVVSDDNQVANNCRAHGAIIEPARFWRPRKRPVPRDQPSPAPGARASTLAQRPGSTRKWRRSSAARNEAVQAG